MFDRLARTLLAHQRIAALLLAGIILATIAGGTRLQTDFSLISFFSAGDEEKVALDAFMEVWGQDVGVVMVVAEATDSDMFRAERLDWIAELSERLASETEAIEGVFSLATTPPLLGPAPGLLDLEPALATLPRGSPEELVAWRERVLSSPLLAPHLVSADGRVMSVAATLTGNPDDPQQLKPRITALRAALAEVPPPAGVQVATAGIPVVRSDFFDVIFEDQMVSVPLTATVMGVVLFLLYRRLHALIAAGLAAMVPPLMVFGTMGFTGEALGILNQSYFTLLPVIAVADAIHMISRFHAEARQLAPDGRPSRELRQQAVHRAVATIGLACLLTTLTTSVGFVSLVSARMPILRSFGVYAAIGVLFAYGAVLLVIPLVLGRTRAAIPEVVESGRMQRLLRGCAEISLTRPWVVLALTAGVLILAVGFGTRVVVDNSLTASLPADHETTVASRMVDEHLGGMLGIELDLQGEEGSLLEPELLRGLLAAGDEAVALEAVRAVGGPATLVATLHQAATGTRSIPMADGAVEQFLSLVEGSDGVETILDTESYGRARLVLRTKDVGANGFVDLCEQVREIFTRHLASVDTSATFSLTGTPWVAYRGINAITLDLRTSLSLAFVFVSLTILVLLRDVRLALLCVVPNMLPLVVGYGLMGAMGWVLDPTPAVVFTIALGIAVDDTIHMMARYTEDRDGGLVHRDAIRSAVMHTGRPVLITSIILCSGFLANVTSSFPTMQVLGMLGASVIFVAMISDLFVLPSLLALFGAPAGGPYPRSATSESPISTPPSGKYSDQRRSTFEAVSGSQKSSSG